MSIGFHVHRNDWLISPQILRQASDAIDQSKQVLQTYDIPYGAGYSKDGRRLYLDHSVPLVLRESGYIIPIAHAWLFHEAVEKALLMFIPGLPYQLAHQVAYNAEPPLLKTYKVPWEIYDRASRRILTDIGRRERYPNCPEDLDLKPYHDEKDTMTLQRMYANGKRIA